ncbi:MAG TPA: SDR family NAD(P)-dependent oxidoreductase, partial [Chryseolinea sp.]
MRFKNKIALVTGGGRDIGKAIALKLASEGAHVIVNYAQSEEAALQTLSDIKASGGDAAVFKADLTNSQEVQKLKDFSIATFGSKLDVLVNNAGGIIGRKKIFEQDEDFYDSVMDLNFKSLFLVTHAFVK